MDNISNNGGDFKMDYISKEENVMVDVFDNSTVRTHTHDFLELAYFVEGEAEHVLNGEKTYIRKGDYLILDYGAYHSYSSKGELKLINCLFHPAFIDKSLVYCRSFNSLLNHYLIKIQSGMLKTSPSNYIFHDTDGTIFPFISRMLYEFRQKQPGYLELIRCNLIELIISTVRKINDNSEFTSSNDTSRMVMKKVNQNYMNHITLGSIAEELNYSLPHLSKKFKEETGQGFEEYLQGVRMEHACRLLANTNKKMNEVAELTGYGDVHFFNRVFRKKMNQSPGEFRKMVKNAEN